MTSLLLHGLQPASVAPVLSAPAHLRIVLRDWVALCTRAPRPTGASDGAAQDEAALIEGALAHDALLRACLSAGDVLPVRFGTAFSGRDALRRALRDNAGTYFSALDRIAGAREFAVRATAAGDVPRGSAPGSAAPGTSAARGGGPEVRVSGRAFLRERRLQRDETSRRRADRQGWAGSMTRMLAQIAREMVPGRLGSDRILSLSLLVPRERESVFQACVGDARAEAARLAIDITVTGPLPAYSFAARPEAGAGRQIAGLVDA